MIRPVKPKFEEKAAFYDEPKSSFDEPTTPSVLARFNGALKILSVIGIFPCKFEDDFTTTIINPWVFCAKWLLISTILLGGYVGSIWYMLDQSTMGFNLKSFETYLMNFISSTITTVC